MLAVGLTLGLLLSLAWRSTASVRPIEASTESARAMLVVEHLGAEQRALKDALAQLRQELTAHQQAAAADTDRLQALNVELQRQRLLAGLLPVRGPGVLVILDDSQAQMPAGADPSAYLIHEYDLRDVVNLLWMAGSEAIAINDERLVSSSSVYCVGSTILVNDTRLSPPYAVRAIGNPRLQQDYLRNPSYLKQLKERRDLYGVRFDVDARADMTLPAYTGGFLVQYARPGE
jgi:uncharacterized protein YlxW (UPF0749 family)